MTPGDKWLLLVWFIVFAVVAATSDIVLWVVFLLLTIAVFAFLERSSAMEVKEERITEVVQREDLWELLERLLEREIYEWFDRDPVIIIRHQKRPDGSNLPGFMAITTFNMAVPVDPEAEEGDDDEDKVSRSGFE